MAMKNTTLLKSAARVIDNPTPASWSIKATFINSTEGSEWSFCPFRIDNIRIVKDFIENIGDDIFLTMTISPKDYALLQDQGQNLLCVLTQTYLNRFGKIVYDPAPLQEQYNVIITDARDVRLSIPDTHLHTEPSLTMTVQLVESTLYKLRHTKINTIFQNCTLTQVIYDLTNKFGIKKVQLTSLDNIAQLDHVPIASYQGVRSVYRDLQAQFGLYAKGANSYLADGVLYVYPPFETNPTYDRSLIFYQVDQGHFAGATAYHMVEDNNTSIVINSIPESYDLSIAGAENIGTGFIFNRASRMTDGFTTIDSKEGAQYTDTSALSISLIDSGRTAVKDLNNIFHLKATDNPYPTMSEIISHQASLMKVEWPNADPFRIDPGHAVAFYYDRNEVMVKKTGIVEYAEFLIMNTGKMDDRDRFQAKGQLKLRLSPNVTTSF